MIYIAGTSIALFISALLLKKRKKSKSDVILLFWMLILATHLYLYYLNSFGNLPSQLIGVHLPIPLLQALFLYFYVSSVTNQFPKNKIIIATHLLPTLLSYFFLIPFFLLSSEERIKLMENHGKGYGAYNTINVFSIYASGIFYVIWSSLLLKKHKKNILDQFSDIEEINLKWLQLLIVGISIIWSIVIFSNNSEYIFTSVAIFVILIGFFGIQQKAIFSTEVIIVKNPNDLAIKTEEKKEKYATSGLSNEAANEKYKYLISKITEDCYYKENNLSLNDLAKKLDMSPNYLSQIINKKEGKNFYDFINSFRVEEFKRLIANPKNKQYTLLALAYDCGFNSKSSFNRSFKKYSGITPSQYIVSIKK